MPGESEREEDSEDGGVAKGRGSWIRKKVVVLCRKGEKTAFSVVPNLKTRVVNTGGRQGSLKGFRKKGGNIGGGVEAGKVNVINDLEGGVTERGGHRSAGQKIYRTGE